MVRAIRLLKIESQFYLFKNVNKSGERNVHRFFYAVSGTFLTGCHWFFKLSIYRCGKI